MTDNPNAFATDPAGTLLPLGGIAAGLPGERAWARRTKALAPGVPLHPVIPPVLAARAATASPAAPQAL
ncbi:hypothetical protein GCM10011504_30920 [Siccirubricoccus deserti]|uniref:Uncharacterized protein n=1 Tax=Siccirubricoccus deserti TaxID=2013562 RepID=A0A9X0R1G6_9PROT|nr:hypothetical protein [Siccirubricoccus deserti]MBC4016592.1 hypothetical protein [Siccirubricoccus deserti]GGC50293.1 hypothetical protein GCM10011504_30920 [Siccirubricoccus deserti]